MYRWSRFILHALRAARRRNFGLRKEGVFSWNCSIVRVAAKGDTSGEEIRIYYKFKFNFLGLINLAVLYNSPAICIIRPLFDCFKIFLHEIYLIYSEKSWIWSQCTKIYQFLKVGVFVNLIFYKTKLVADYKCYKFPLY